MRLMGSVMAPGGRWHIICSGVMLYLRNRSLCANKKLQDVEQGLEEEKGKVSEMLAVKDQVLSYNISSGIYNRGTRPKYLFHASVLEIVIHFRRKAATWNAMLYKAEYKPLEN